MEVLKKVLLLTAVIVIAAGVVFAQENARTAQAFSESYQLEAKWDYQGAIETLKPVYEEGSYELNMRLGWLNYLTGKYTESEDYYKKAVVLKSYSIEAKFGYVYPLAALGNMKQVSEQYKDILKIDKEQTTANYRLGLICYYNSDFENAKKYFENVVNLYPMDHDSTLMLAWTYLNMKKSSEAKILFDKMLILFPDDKSALEGLALIK